MTKTISKQKLKVCLRKELSSKLFCLVAILKAFVMVVREIKCFRLFFSQRSPRHKSEPVNLHFTRKCSDQMFHQWGGGWGEGGNWTGCGGI